MVRVQEGDEREINFLKIEYALQLQFLLFLSGACLLSRYHMRTIFGVYPGCYVRNSRGILQIQGPDNSFMLSV